MNECQLQKVKQSYQDKHFPMPNIAKAINTANKIICQTGPYQMLLTTSNQGKQQIIHGIQF